MRQSSALWIYPEVKQQPSMSTNISALTFTLELRNTIYSYCKTPGNESLSRRSPSVDEIGHRTYFHLCQVNYQIRQEALLLQYQNFTHRVPLRDLAAYMETFLLPHKGHSLVGSTSFTFQTDRLFSRLNITTLIRVCKRHLNFTVRLDGFSSVRSNMPVRSDQFRTYYRASNIDAHFHKLIDSFRVLSTGLRHLTASQRRWSEYLDNAVEGIWIHDDSKGLNVDIVVKSEASEPWMDDFAKLNRWRWRNMCDHPHYKKEYDAWVHRTGAPWLCTESIFSVRVASSARA